MNRVSPKNIKLCSACGKFEAEELHDGFKVNMPKKKKTTLYGKSEKPSSKVKSLF